MADSEAGGWGRWVWQQVGGADSEAGGWVGGRWVSLAGQVYKLVVKGWGCAGKQLSDGVSLYYACVFGWQVDGGR